VEHPYLILTSVFSIFGLEEWAASNAHVTYMWLCMITLIFFGWLAGKSVSMVPGTSQNVFETLVGGLEEFVVGITGEEGRKSVPFVITIFLFVLLGNLFGLVPGFFPPTASIKFSVLLLLHPQYTWLQAERKQMPVQYCKGSLSYFPSFWKYGRTRTCGWNTFITGRSVSRTSANHGSGCICCACTGICLLSACNHVYCRCNRRSTLNLSFTGYGRSPLFYII